MTQTTVWSGSQYLEYLVAHLKQQPAAQVWISTFLIQYQPSGVLHDLYKELNKRPSCIYVGTTRYIREGSVNKEIKRISKAHPHIKIRLTYNDHRKVFLLRYPTYNGAVRLPDTYRAWVGSQNLHDSNTRNCVVELPATSIPALREEMSDIYERD
jgi:hypothetical protein